MPLFFGSSGQRVEQGASEARKRPRWGVCRPLCVSRHGSAASEPRRPLHRASQRRLWCFFFLPAMGGRGRSADGAARVKGAFSFAKENTPFISPKRTAGAFRLRPCTPNDQKGGASPLLFGLSTPLLLLTARHCFARRAQGCSFFSPLL